MSGPPGRCLCDSEHCLPACPAAHPGRQLAPRGVAGLVEAALPTVSHQQRATSSTEQAAMGATGTLLWTIGIYSTSSQHQDPHRTVNAVLPSPHVDSPIDVLNSACFCVSLDTDALARALDSELGQPGLAAMVRQRCPFLFAAQPVFVAAAQLQRMAQVMQAVESVVALPAYRDQVLAAAPAIARLGTAGPLGVFFGYDFHLHEGRLGLIEVNTNAGGAMLNAVLARAQRARAGRLGSREGAPPP